MGYTHIFFDLDHTLWDFDRNAGETLYELYHFHALNKLGLSSPEIFIETYTRTNHSLWAEYHLGKISRERLREQRFKNTFIELGVAHEAIPEGFEEDYMRICPAKTHLFPQAEETLRYLSEKYELHLISNGFKETTELKIDRCGLAAFFKTIVIAEVVGISKPQKAIFEFALNTAGARKEQSLMIGDSIEADIRGAMQFGIDAVYFNPLKRPKPDDVQRQIFNLKELMDFL